MHFDNFLAAAVRKRMIGQSAGRQVYAEEQIAAYKNACGMSRGKVAARSGAWQARAETLREELAAMAGGTVERIREECLEG